MEIDKPNEPLYLLSSSQIIHEYLNLWKYRVKWKRKGVRVYIDIHFCSSEGSEGSDGSEVSKQQTDDVEDYFK